MIFSVNLTDRFPWDISGVKAGPGTGAGPGAGVFLSAAPIYVVFMFPGIPSTILMKKKINTIEIFSNYHSSWTNLHAKSIEKNDQKNN